MTVVRKPLPILLALCLLATAALAETRYVTDELTLTFRSGPSNEHKILSFIKSGQRLEVLEDGERWSKVRLPDGREGWVLSQYLVGEPASRDLLEGLKAKHQSLTEQAERLMADNERLTEENRKLQAEVAEYEKALEALRADYDALQRDSAGFTALKQKYEKTAAELEDKTKRLTQLEDQVASMELNHLIKWFLAGSGVLVAGFFLGFASRRPRRRSSLL